jgi:hypothetical protein
MTRNSIRFWDGVKQEWEQIPGIQHPYATLHILSHTLHISFKKESFPSLKKFKLLFLNLIYRKVKRRGKCLWYNEGLRLQLRWSCIFQSDSTPKVDLLRETFLCENIRKAISLNDSYLLGLLLYKIVRFSLFLTDHFKLREKTWTWEKLTKSFIARRNLICTYISLRFNLTKRSNGCK